MLMAEPRKSLFDAMRLDIDLGGILPTGQTSSGEEKSTPAPPPPAQQKQQKQRLSIFESQFAQWQESYDAYTEPDESKFARWEVAHREAFEASKTPLERKEMAVCKRIFESENSIPPALAIGGILCFVVARLSNCRCQ